jgi:hypothetical protein
MAMSHTIPFRSVLVASLATIVACGGEETTREAAPQVIPQDTQYTPITREPLTESDLAGLAMIDVSIEVPWTTNRVRRGPVEHAARASLRAAEVSAHEDFDRVLFRFTDTTPFPGYEISFADSALSVPCGDNGAPYELTGERAVVIRFTPARASEGDETFVSVGIRPVSQTRFQETGLVCEDERTVAWVATLAAGDHVRVLELHNPNRLAVDIR